MGNNGSSARDQRQPASSSFRSKGLAVVETGRGGWSQSFPRELARHRERAQPSAVRKVLPTGAVQRLRATDNGTIIHSGGTISGRRPPTYSSARDLVKRDESTSQFGERIGSASNLAAERRPSRRFDRHWCRYRADSSSRPDAIAGSVGLKRSGSEPDLRPSPDFVRASVRDRSSPAGSLSNEHREEPRPAASCHRYGRESKDRLESRYRARKKYKAPAPPGLLLLDEPVVSGSEMPNERPPPLRQHRHQHRQQQQQQQQQRQKVQPPPRRSRLFKTRVESKKAQVGWQPSANHVDRSTSPRSRSRTSEPSAETEAAAAAATSVAVATVTTVQEESPSCPKSPDHGKNTLQRSMSSPEFRAELIQAAKRVRDKLEFRGRTTPVGGEPSSIETADRVVFGAENSTIRDPSVPSSDAIRDPPSATERRRRSLGYANSLEASRGDRTEGSGRNNHPLTENPREPEYGRSFPSTAQSAPKTFYFGMNDGPNGEPRNDDEARYPAKDVGGRNRVEPLLDTSDDTDDNDDNVVENISLNIRPTLPKKQLEIPRFSPSAAWRLLSAIEAPGPSTSTASEELPLMFEERIERLSRPPPLFPLSLGTRSWQDKSGDSGISGDAGAANEDSLDVGTINRIKPAATRPAWTPQQDLGEESSSDAGVDSPPPLPVPFGKRHPRRAHVFSLSLPRDDSRGYLYGHDSKPRGGTAAFNSLQKLKRSVSGAFGIGTHDHRKQSTRELVDDNWLLSCSAPTSLQPNQITLEPSPISPSGWPPFSANPNDSFRRSREIDVLEDQPSGYEDRLGDGREDEDKRNGRDRAKDFPVVMKPPSFSYLAPAGHPMYLPEVNQAEHRVKNFTARNVRPLEDGNAGKRIGYFTDRSPFRSNGYDYDRDRDREPVRVRNETRPMRDEEDDDEEQVEHEEEEEEEEEVAEEREEEQEEQEEKQQMQRPERTIPMEMEKRQTKKDDDVNENGAVDVDSDRVNADNAPIRARARAARICSVGADFSTRNKGRSSTFGTSRNSWSCSDQPSIAAVIPKETKAQRRNASKGKRFTFQSTVRQIERRRLAERLSREAEAKERQRKGELEAMRKVEEEFQRKRAKEKANIRQQLRLYKEMEENFDSLPILDWDGGCPMSRAEPDGAASSTASSPISMSNGKKDVVRGSESKERPADQKSYRPKYYDWSPDIGSHADNRHTTVHPKVVCDIPKRSAVFVDANVHSCKPITSGSTPRSDNYRKDFAHGMPAAKACFASSESELSQPNTRPHSRQNGPKGSSHRSRSGSPGRDKREDAASSEEEAPAGLPPTHPARNPVHDLLLSGLQPYTKRKAYRPISFNPPQTSTPISS